MTRWQAVRLADVANVQSGDGAPQENGAFSDSGKPFIRAGSLSALLNGSREADLEKIHPEEASRRRMTEFPAGTIVFAKSGMSSTKGLVYQLRQPALVVNHLAAIECGDRLDSSFLKRWFEWNSPSRLVSNPAYPSIKLSTIRDAAVRLPPLAEQKRIANILDAADALRAKRRQSLVELDSLLQSTFLEMFGDPVENPKGWKSAKISDFCRLVRGSSPRPKGDPRFYGGEVPRLMVGDITRDGFWVTPRIDSLTIEGAKKSRPVPEGTVVMAVSGNVGVVSQTSTDCCIHDGFVAFLDVDTQLVDEVFFKFQLNLLKLTHENRKAGAIFQNLTTKDIKAMDIMCPPLEAQIAFREFVTQLNSQQRLLSKGNHELDSLSGSIQQRAFAGEL